MPPAVRDWFEAQRVEQEAAMEDAAFIGPERLGADSIEDLDATQLMARKLEIIDVRARFRQQARDLGVPPAMDAPAQSVALEYRVLGSVEGGKDVVYVMYEASPRFGQAPFGGVYLAELRRHGTGWGIWNHLTGPELGWVASAILHYDGPTELPSPDSLFRWPESDGPALTIRRDARGHFLFTITEHGEGSPAVVLPPAAVEALLDYLSTMHFTDFGAAEADS